MSERRGGPVRVDKILRGLSSAGRPAGDGDVGAAARVGSGRDRPRTVGVAPAQRGAARYDYDLAEFPLFRFDAVSRRRLRHEPLVYADRVTARDGTKIERVWRAVPGPLGVGGPGTQLLLFDLLQLYLEQGGSGDVVRYGTMRSFLRRRGGGHPSRRDFARLRRDLEILKGYEIHASNAFWDARMQGYVDRRWRLLAEDAGFVRSGGRGSRGEVRISPELREIAATRGLFPVGLDRDAFRRLKPLEQRLALYLGRKLRYQAVHRRRVEDLLQALPIVTARPRDGRASLARAARGLLDGGFAPLGAFTIAQHRAGRWIAEFRRAYGPASAVPSSGDRCDPIEVDRQVDRIVRTVGSARDRAWWARCVRRLGAGPVDRALGQLAEACRTGRVRSRGALLTKIFKDIAAEAGIVLTG